MGCDIHLQVERRVNGKWERVKRLPSRPCSWCSGTGKRGPEERECYWCHERAKRETGRETPGADVTAYHDQNYTVFAALADVRNDGYIRPISQPRGLPEDATHAKGKDEDGEKISDYEYGDHSFSWLTLAELRAYDWKQEIRDEGWVSAPVFAEWDKAGCKGPPKEWCADVGGASIQHVTHYRMREFIADGMKQHPLIERIGGKKSFYTLAQWTVPLAEYCKYFLAFMESLSGLGAPEDVRIVFGFDS